ncbi:MAG: hypothetical protein AAB510_01140 [Patescibacteria group bacterium]
MKKYLSLFVLLAMVFAFNAVAKAEDGTSSTGTTKPGFRGEELKERRDEFKNQVRENRDAFREKVKTERKTFVDNLKSRRETFKTELKAKKEEWKILKEDKKVEFCGKAKEMVTRRFEVAIGEVTKAHTRLEEVISKLKTNGKDTASAEAALKLSKDKLAEAKTKLADIKKLVPEGENVCKNMTPETFEKIKISAREARDLLKEAREEIHNTIKEIKNLRTEKSASDDANKDEDKNENE